MIACKSNFKMFCTKAVAFLLMFTAVEVWATPLFYFYSQTEPNGEVQLIGSVDLFMLSMVDVMPGVESHFFDGVPDVDVLPGMAGCEFQGWYVDPKTPASNPFSFYKDRPMYGGDDLPPSFWDSGDFWDFFTNDTARTDFYAKWNVVEKREIIFNANDDWCSTHALPANVYPLATGQMPNVECVVGQDVQLPKNEFNKDGFVFKGWATAAASPVTYLDGATVRASDFPPGSNFLLYAVWEAKTVVITLDYREWSGASQNIKTKTATTGYGIQMPWFPIVTSSSDVIDGWYTAPSGGTRVDTGTWWVPTKDTTYYLHWRHKTCTIKFNANGGTGSMPNQPFTMGINQRLSVNQFQHDGYVFSGWAKSSDGAVVYTDGEGVLQPTVIDGGTVTLYAVWTKEETEDEPLLPDWTPVVQPDTVIGYYVVKNAKTDDFVEADGSVLGVFAADGECRGATRVTRGPGGLLFQLTIGVANSSESGFSFKVWDAATGEIHNVNEKISSFVGVETFGSILAPITLTFGDHGVDPTVVRDGVLIRYEDPIVSGESPAIPSEVRAIGDGCFALASNLTSVVIPESVTNIGPYAFFGCSNLETVVFHEGLVSIDSGAFAECVSLGEITLPSSVRRVGDALAPTNAVAAIVQCNDDSAQDSTNFVETVSGRQVSRYQEKSEELHEMTLWNRGWGAFDGCRALANVTLNDGLEMLGAATFRDCISLTELEVPESVVRIGGQMEWVEQEEAQSRSHAMASQQTDGEAPVLISSDAASQRDVVSLSHRDAGFLEGCVNLERVVLPQELESLGPRAFANCRKLQEINLPEHLSALDRGTFFCCTKLARVGLPSDVEIIGKGELPYLWQWTYASSLQRQNGGLASVMTVETISAITNGVVSSARNENGGAWRVVTAENRDMRYEPEDGAFYGCAALHELELPATVQTLCDYSFAGCNSLQLMFDGPPPTCGANAIADCKVGFYLPEKADQWGPVIVGGLWNGLEMRELSDVPSPATERSQDLTLSGQGWHEVSFAVLPEGGDPADVFAPVEDKIGYVTYGSLNWSPTAGGTLTALEIGKGYWVQTTAENVSWTVTGQGNPDVEIALKAGWNLIGYPLLEEGNIETVLATALATGNIRYIYSGSRVYPGTLTTLKPGKGYWVYANAAATIRFDVK